MGSSAIRVAKRKSSTELRAKHRKLKESLSIKSSSFAHQHLWNQSHPPPNSCQISTIHQLCICANIRTKAKTYQHHCSERNSVANEMSRGRSPQKASNHQKGCEEGGRNIETGLNNNLIISVKI